MFRLFSLWKHTDCRSRSFVHGKYDNPIYDLTQELGMVSLIIEKEISNSDRSVNWADNTLHIAGRRNQNP